MASIDDFKTQWLDSRPYIEAHTSGSTGIPKTIRLNKSDMRTSARATNAFFNIDSHSCLASPLSVDYIAGKMMVVRAIEAHCPLIVLPVSNNIDITDQAEQIDLLPIVPSQIASLLEQPLLAAKVRNLLIGGAAPSPDDCRRLADAGYNAFISYGMTEACSHVALARADDPDRIFTAMPGITFNTTSDSRLIIEAPHFTFRQLITNDIVELLSPTTMRWRGRADGVINTGGLKLLPEELEELYRFALPGRTYYVAPSQHPKWGQAVTLYIEAQNEEIPAIAQALQARIADHRSLPKLIVPVDHIPRTPNGKIKRTGA